MSKNPFIDIILPNYNKDEFLEETINSIISQTYNNWKLFVIDDNSQDNSRKILENYKNKNIKIIYLRKNKGVSFCRNLGIRISDSKYISFIDSDDLWSQDKLQEQISFMEKFNYDFTYTDYSPFILRNNEKFYKKKVITSNFFTYGQFLNNTSIGMSSVIIKRSAIGYTRFKKLRICEDYLFKCDLLKKNITARKFNQNTMFYRIVKNSLQSSKFRNLYWIWYINKKYNKLTILNNLKSILFITISSMKRYGIK